MKRLTPFEFIKRATLIHGDKYDYSGIKFVYSNSKIPIICKKHNHEFHQSAITHLKGCGCPICGGKIKLTSEIFIEKAKKNMVIDTVMKMFFTKIVKQRFQLLAQ